MYFNQERKKPSFPAILGYSVFCALKSFNKEHKSVVCIFDLSTGETEAQKDFCEFWASLIYLHFKIQKCLVQPFLVKHLPRLKCIRKGLKFSCKGKNSW